MIREKRSLLLKVLVLGGTRFVGKRLVARLAAAGAEITMLNRGKTVAPPPPGVKRLYADRRDSGAVCTALRGQSYDLVCDITGYQVANLEPVVAALEGNAGHYIFQSTGAVYRPMQNYSTTEDAPYITPETAPPNEAAYALEKAACERYLLGIHAAYDFPVTVFRSPVIYGPENWMHDREASYFVRLALGRAALIPADRKVVLPHVYVDDVAEAYLAAAGKTKTFGQAYNVGGDATLTVEAYIDAVARAMEKPVDKIYLTPEIERTLERPVFFFPYENSQRYAVGKAREDFGFTAAHDINAGMREAYAWWVEHVGVAGTHFVPGKLGHDVDFEFEDRVIEVCRARLR